MAPDRRTRLALAFYRRFGHQPLWIAEAPGRVNLIGEHTDYNEGLVLPAAIDRTVMVAVAPSRRSGSRVWSLELNQESPFDALNPERSPEQPWSNYVLGMAWALAEAGYPPVQVDLAVAGNVPIGAGLSSSAALEVASGAAMAAASGALPPSPVLARLAHRAEADFVGVPCGIMDQFTSCLAREDHALLIDCRTRDTEQVPLRLEEQGVALVVVDSGVRRSLAKSPYAERRRQCEEAFDLLKPLLPKAAGSLRDVAFADLDGVGRRLPLLLLRRARHVVSENARVACCVQALRERRLDDAGFLFAQSHRSLRDDYEVSCPELDLLVELAGQTPGILGARLTGAGFGGCTVNLVHAGSVGRFEAHVVAEYRRRTGKPARAYVCRAAGGADVAPWHSY